MNNWTLFLGGGGALVAAFVGLFLGAISGAGAPSASQDGHRLFPSPLRCCGCRCSATARCMRSSTATRPLPRGDAAPPGARVLQPAGRSIRRLPLASVATITGLLFYVTRRLRRAGAGEFHLEAEGHQQRRPELAAHFGRWPSSVDRDAMTAHLGAAEHHGGSWGCRSAFVIFFVI